MTADPRPAPRAPASAGIKRPRAAPPPSLLDVAIYAPIGFASRFRSLLPELVQSGKSQVALVKFVGSGVLGRSGLFGASGANRSPLAASGTSPGAQSTSGAETPDSPGSAASAVAAQPVVADRGKAPSRRTARPPAVTRAGARGDRPRRPSAAAPAGATRRSTVFPIEGYDTLAASAVVALLPTLSPGDRALVRERESAGRGRRTVLARLDQLDAG